jgi:hypothetical protein
MRLDLRTFWVERDGLSCDLYQLKLLAFANAQP